MNESLDINSILHGSIVFLIMFTNTGNASETKIRKKEE